MQLLTIAQNRDQLLADLHTLSARFAAMQAEFECVLRDANCDLEGYVVVWNTEISRHGPLPFCGKGGTRIREGLSLDEVKMLAKKMALKNAAAGLPLGGSKSGIKADPRAPGFEKQYRRFVQLCRPFLHENGGTFGGFGYDIGAAPEQALWACDELKSTRSFTGKTQAMGGTDYDREGIAGLGVAEAAAELLRLNQHDLNTAKFSVHGVGAMGAAVIRYFNVLGPQLKCIGDPKFGGSWHFDTPPSPSLVEALIQQDSVRCRRLLESQAQCISKDPNAVLFADSDVLFPCALQYVINEANAHLVQCRYLVEGANNPCTDESYALLHGAGVLQLPDFIANSGGIIAAFVELTSSISDDENAHSGSKIIEAKNRTREVIGNNVAQIFKLAQMHNVSLRDAGLYCALNAIFSTGKC